MWDTRAHKPVVVAVGGNSVDGLENPTANNIITLHRYNRLVVTHGNGPQVGKILEEAEKAGITKSLAQCTRETQQEIGEDLRRHIYIKANERHLPPSVEDTVINFTHVFVDPEDPAFKNPTKYIGREFDRQTIMLGAREKENGLYEWKKGSATWIMKEVPGKPGIFRRVVASPKPIKTHPQDLAEIESGVFLHKIVIAAGGGGVPIFPDGSRAEAVIDKDLATALLCRELEAQSLVISTGVRYVAHNFASPKQKDILYYQLKHALRNLKKKTGEYPAGAMGEKIEAAINALRFGVNEVMITHPQASWINGEGTIITRGLDFTGRLYNLARFLGFAPLELQRWLVT